MEITETEYKSILNSMLIDHYVCFNSERFWLDEFKIYPNKMIFISIASNILDTDPHHLCRNIAKYIKKNFVDKYRFKTKYIYVGAWAVRAESL